MQSPDRKPTPALVFDSSMKDDIGQVLALTMLLGYESKREFRLTSLSISNNNLRIAAFCDLMSRFFGATPSIGMTTSGASTTNVPPMLQAVLGKRTPDDTPTYVRTIGKLNDTADPVALIRNALTAQQDQNSTVVLAGPPVNLLGLLALPGTRQLIQKKVRTLILAEPLGSADDLAKLLADWPGPSVLVKEDLGQALPFPAESIEKDFDWATNHPLVDAYRAFKPMPFDAPSTAMAAILYAAHPEENYFRLSEPQGKQRQLMPNAEKKEQVLGAYRQAVSTKPPEPRRGIRGAQP